MGRRFISIWFPHLRTDWFGLKERTLHERPFVLRSPVHGRMIISACNIQAERKGINTGLVLADARALVPGLEARDDVPGLSDKVLQELAVWCIRFTPVVAVDPPHGLFMEVTGCAHLWGGETSYMAAIESRLNARGYGVRIAMADTPGVAWAMARYGAEPLCVKPGEQDRALEKLPPESLRIGSEVVERLHKLGLHRIGQFVNMPKQVLRRRFGQSLLDQIEKAQGWQIDDLLPVMMPVDYEERLPCLEPIATREGIVIALEKLLMMLCGRLQKEQKGLRRLCLKGYRVDGKVAEAKIGTHRPTHHVKHLMKLFDHKISGIEPGLGIELFLLQAFDVEDNPAGQERLWESGGGLTDERLSELIDRMVDRGGIEVSRYLPAEHYWPERSYRRTTDLAETVSTPWRTDVVRPSQIWDPPQLIEVTAPIPDYPPMLFIYEGKVHRIMRADGPERIEQEWWLQQGQHRDYYQVEDEEGGRYWIFRLGHYHDKNYQWFIHGFFA
jgi:protein ImuB